MPITTSSAEARQHFLAGRSLSKRLRARESLTHFAQAIAADSSFALAYLNYSFVQPSPKGFFEQFAKARALADSVSPAERLWILGVEAGVNGQPAQQREHFRQLVELYPGDERAHNTLGNHYFGQQLYSQAIAEYGQPRAIAPDFSPLYNQLGYAHRFLGQYDAARKAFEKYIELIPDDPTPTTPTPNYS
jgi:tetratricopeptide (TPR) repeat protein